MLKSKLFTTPNGLTSWINRHPECEVLSVANAGKGGFVAFYETDATGSLGTERVELIRAKIKVMANYPAATKAKLGFAEAIIPYMVVPFTRLHNSLRNLKAFKGMPGGALGKLIVTVCREAGCNYIPRAEAKAEYGTNCSLIEL